VDRSIAGRAIRRTETGAARTMIDRATDRFGLRPEALITDIVYGSTPMLGRLVEEHSIEPRVPVFDKSACRDGACERVDCA
jgi:hypothetical protein